jgi:hypothetical protein
MGVQSQVAGRWVEVLAEACEGAKHGEEKACLDCLITKNRPEGGLERAQRIIHHVQGQHPSPEDIAVTRSLIQAGELMQIEVLDHLIIGQGRWISLREQRLCMDDRHHDVAVRATS